MELRPTVFLLKNQQISIVKEDLVSIDLIDFGFECV
ncbi:MAG: hypothetical protein ACJAS1_005229 [Oleiphilaceae bacterium]|jgi:hypothetical protein